MCYPSQHIISKSANSLFDPSILKQVKESKSNFHISGIKNHTMILNVQLNLSLSIKKTALQN